MLQYIDKLQNPKNWQDTKYLQDSNVQSVIVLKAETYTECYHQLAHAKLFKNLIFFSNVQPCKVKAWQRWGFFKSQVNTGRVCYKPGYQILYLLEG